MILELSKGREIKLPDNMDDETARQIGKMILALEKRTEQAEASAEAAALRTDALRASVESMTAGVTQATTTNDSLLGAIAELQRTMEILLGRVVAAQLASRILVEDEFGRPMSQVKKEI